MEKKLTPKKIAKIIDPRNTFLDECERAKQFLIKGVKELKW